MTPSDSPLDNGIFTIRVTQAGGIDALLEALNALRREASLKVLVLQGLEQASTDARLHEEIAGVPCPVIAMMPDGGGAAGFLAAALCDFMVLAEEAEYSHAGVGPADGRYFATRFGNGLASDLLHPGASFSGRALRDKGLGCPIVPRQEVEANAYALAHDLAGKSRRSLRLLKQHLARLAAPTDVKRAFLTALDTLPLAPESEATCTPGPVPLKSTVISATAHADGVIVVSMADREAKNMFSDQFIAGMAEVFDHIDAAPGYKVVVLTGYDSYFASGGTRAALLAIQEGKASFTDDRTFRIALDCKLPVIAAMQGHAIGGGLSLGLFADILVLSESSKYFSPYMAYGFTPGAGATLIVPEKMGLDLGREALLSAREYAGSELKARGLAHAMYPRKQVLPAALEIARQVGRHKRADLIQLKQQTNRSLHERLAENTRLELAMHAQTFVGQADTLQQIDKVFDPMNPDTAQSSPSLAHTIASLKTMLADELQMSEQDIDNDAQFVDLGLDSITGVTWMRKINASYGTEIAAIKVYSFPTLTQLGEHVQAVLGGATIAPPPAPAHSGIVGNLKRLLAEELHMAEHEIDEDAQFVDLGLDSITGVTWVRKINAEYGTNVAAIQVYSHPTLNQLAGFVRGEAGEAAPVVAPAPAAQRPAPKTRNKLVSWRGQKPSRQATAGAPQSIAVIGMAGQFPQARTLDQFWRNIADGRNCITEVAAARWNVDAYYQPGEPVPGKTNSCWLGALDDYDRFDPLFFNISPGEAESMDPQQRLFLEACWHGIEHAGYNPRALAGSKCGVFVGCGSGDYQLQSRELRLSAQGFVGGAPSILAARISYFLNLQGPCLAIDTACSSSLVALANACDSLNAGNSDMALAGGVYVMVGPDMQIKTAQAGMLSTDGRCYTFDQRANGFVPGEAVGVVVLKRLADARRDGDPIVGVIEGWGINQDGKTNGITAPNPESQTRLQQEVYERFQIDPAGITLVEAHGTGTKLGDPIEVAALKESFKKYTANRQYCALGSVKSNIGHCLQAAGITSFIKTMLALKHQQLPPTINFERLNEHIDLQDTPFYVNRTLRHWTPNSVGQRRAAISSFGFSGTNAHLVVGQYQAPVRAPFAGRGPGLVPLSAKSPEALAKAARQLLAFLRGEGSNADLADIAYTLQIGREAMEERLCVVAANAGELAQALQAFIDGKGVGPAVYHANIKRHREGLSLISQDAELRDAIVEKCIAHNNLAKLADWWVKGLAFDWNALYSQERPTRIALPVYPFARERYWIDAQAEEGPSSGLLQLHPLLHENTSDLYQASFGSTFSGREFFLADHRVQFGASVAPMLPGVAYLEMARAAVARALPGLAPSAIVELRDVVWLQPVLVTAASTVSVALSNDGDQIDFSISSLDGDAQVTHCEGSALHYTGLAPLRIDLAALRARTQRTALDGATLYPMFAKMGLHYGATHQGVASIEIGDADMLAELRMPPACRPTAAQFMLHPAMADSALQATVGLIFDLESLPGRPAVPFALESIRLYAPCPEAMTVWVRYAQGSRSGDAVVKLDLDLCDTQGNVCVQMRGFAARIIDGAALVRHKEADGTFDEVFYQGVIDGLLGDEVSVDDAAELG
jgi:acyl transferase domain-containing protein/enoyl-CoA hydratase/carnithine racemase/acyl carrier protein